jgi:hypothetical protein
MATEHKFHNQSGVPMTLTTGINNAGTNNPLPDRPSFSGVGTGYLSTPTPTSQGLRWFDPASFIVSPQGTFGNVGRNTMITPHFQSIDMALAKRFTMPYSEHHALQLRLEAFNVFNHPSWGAPNANILAGASFPGAPANAAHQGFGVISTTAIPDASDSTGYQVFVLRLNHDRKYPPLRPPA